MAFRTRLFSKKSRMPWSTGTWHDCGTQRSTNMVSMVRLTLNVLVGLLISTGFCWTSAPRSSACRNGWRNEQRNRSRPPRRRLGNLCVDILTNGAIEIHPGPVSRQKFYLQSYIQEGFLDIRNECQSYSTPFYLLWSPILPPCMVSLQAT